MAKPEGTEHECMSGYTLFAKSIEPGDEPPTELAFTGPGLDPLTFTVMAVGMVATGLGLRFWAGRRRSAEGVS